MKSHILATNSQRTREQFPTKLSPGENAHGLDNLPLRQQISHLTLQQNMQLVPKIALEFSVFYSMNQTPFLAQNDAQYGIFIIALDLAS
jgi:hypothetical protein